MPPCINPSQLPRRCFWWLRTYADGLGDNRCAAERDNVPGACGVWRNHQVLELDEVAAIAWNAMHVSNDERSRQCGDIPQLVQSRDTLAFTMREAIAATVRKEARETKLRRAIVMRERSGIGLVLEKR